MLRKRYIIETIFDQLKNIAQIEHTRHRSPVSFKGHLLAGLIAYTFNLKNPVLIFLALKKTHLCRSEVNYVEFPQSHISTAILGY